MNQIAAGEVIERPASVLKELVENALDAGARSIEIHLVDGGTTQIQVVDDGHGISQADLLLAIERHATSKISGSDDLEGISSYGFRGEALSSIAAVSRLELRSRIPDSPTGYSVECEFGGNPSSLKPVGMPAGTRVTIADLFGRLPARKKYLRSHQTEYAHSARVARELALGSPQTRFSLFHGGRQIFAYPASSRRQRFVACDAPPWEPLVISADEADMKLEAYLTPTHQIQDRGALSLYVNGRAIRNRGFFGAVRAAYQSSLGPHHEPSGVVYLQIEPTLVDVNVHPQKWEVRLHKQERIYGWLTALIRKELAKARTVVEWTSPSLPYLPYLMVAEPTPAGYFPEQQALAATPASLPASLAVPQSRPVQAPLIATPKPNQPPSSSVHYLGQLRAAYLLCEDAHGLLLFDQHALHEKFLYERLRAQSPGNTPSQALLIPLVCPVSVDRLATFERHHETFEAVGFSVDVFGACELVIRSVPVDFPTEKAQAVLMESLITLAGKDVGDEAKAATAIAATTARDRVFASQACHSAVTAGQKLTDLEARCLLEDLSQIQEGWTCPHGRPILFRLGFSAIEKHFERR